MKGVRFAAGCALSLAIGGCASFQVVNEPLEQVDPTRGYRQSLKHRGREPGGVWLSLAFSGGGTRAAAFAYGVMEELRDTLVTIEGKPVQLVHEIDVISAVSGGTFPAVYYGLFGDRIFEDFEEKFLNRNIQRALFFQALRPWNLLRLFSPYLTRSMLASQYYDRKVFDGATFADLAAAPGPHIHINATDLSHGYRFTFSQGQFDVICSNLDVLPVATAVAASSAVPVLLTPITLRNFAGTCGFVLPKLIEDALQLRGMDRRRYEAALSFADFVDTDRREFIHLVDGGIADNLGLRFSIELTAAAGGADRVREAMGVEAPEHFVLIVVNAETDPDPSIDLSAASPSLASMMSSISGSQIRRYNLETLLLVQDSMDRWAADLSRGGQHAIKPYLIDVSFDSIPDQERRSYFKLIPTSFFLDDTTVQDLREAGRRLLREEPNFQRLLEALK